MQIDRKVVEQALEALEPMQNDRDDTAIQRTITALKAALEQTEQAKPVAIVSSVTEPGQYGVKVRWLGGFPQIAMKLYSHPPRKQEPLCK